MPPGDEHAFAISNHVNSAQRHSLPFVFAGEKPQHTVDYAYAWRPMLSIGEFEHVADEPALERVGKRSHGLPFEALIASGIHHNQRSVQFSDHLLKVGIVGS